ncbi:hypothetical protein EO244_04605 [Ancylomarina salipaludis]|uniref:6-bladed beta-propeller n=1 Tax=Ancylomarina salipaludis TaxID=2501299 RepID=A0A4Q1JPH0_9BACT|nr:hypothetical protein [Ancylomarina salipaludis]RXQ96130.1 hypothetical protein EO244_04605 [Ancylomarina salipaludis]
MRKFVLTILLSAIIMSVSAQKLIDIYKKGLVKLTPDTEYALNNNWNQVFKTYYDTIYNTPMGNRKSLKLLPDGSVLVNHQYRNYYSKFAPNGTFVKEFGIRNSKGKQFKRIDPIEGVINNNLFTKLDNMGNMVCCDFDGNYIKTLKLDYMAKQMIPIGDTKIAVSGWVIWENQFRDFVSIVDYETNEEKVIWEHFTDRSHAKEHTTMFQYSYAFKGNGMFSINTMPLTNDQGLTSHPKIAISGDELVIAIPDTGEVLVYDFNGKLKSEQKIEWARNYISIEEQKAIQSKAIAKYKSIKNPRFANWVTPEENQAALNKVIREMEDDLKNISKPLAVPVFSNIIKDSDGNLLFFEFPKEVSANKFNVWIYKEGGQFISQSSFVCDDYDLQITPSKMVFRDGYIYALQNLKNTSGVPLRLVRFKLNN